MSREHALDIMRGSRAWWRDDVYEAFLRELDAVWPEARDGSAPGEAL